MNGELGCRNQGRTNPFGAGPAIRGLRRPLFATLNEKALMVSSHARTFVALRASTLRHRVAAQLQGGAEEVPSRRCDRSIVIVRLDFVS